MLNEFLKQFAKEYWEGEDRFTKEAGSYNLTFGKDLSITIKEMPNKGLAFLGEVAPLPLGRVEEYLLKIMEANLFGKETGENVLALSSDGKQVILTRSFYESITYPLFRETIEDFLNYLESWKIDTIAFTGGK